ncbi:TFIIH/NER complex subunit [Saccharomycopsis crataegensis]|uniref:RNA polymerase II transcription factor B subunit 2 n=1 Tax=Saccharomycopsis crataegensis TaxID=43959 RepID=A0AAV5QS54_9ASCO|nr:TFIIH/NER complex subunit [Saccharomycopsis crataegensis]
MSSYLFKDTVNEYLENLPYSMKSKLFKSPATCLAIYRLLPNLAKFYIMSMVFHEKPVNSRIWDVWVKDSDQGKKLEVEGLRRMKSLNLITEKNNYLVLDEHFRESFRNALVGNDSHHAFGVPCATDENNKTSIDFLDEFATKKWESILHFMVGTELDELPSVGVLSLLKHSGLMEINGDITKRNLTSVNITKEGFSFLLQDVNAQIWTLLLEYLKIAETLNMDSVDVLNFIFMLGSLELGKDYSLEALSETQIKMLEDLRDYGLVYQRKASSKRFYPTRLATTLTSDSTTLRSVSSAMNKAIRSAKQDNEKDVKEEEAQVDFVSGTIIVETNFKLYCYATSPLQIAILNLFVHLKSRFSNLVTGQITRESIQRALKSGIASDQIIAYLEVNAHPQMKKLAQAALNKKIEFESVNGMKASHLSLRNLEIVPSNIVDQIKLWQLELDRIQAFGGYLFKDFKGEVEYKGLLNYAEEIGVLLYKDNANRKFFVTDEGRQQLIDYASRRTKRQKKS